MKIIHSGKVLKLITKKSKLPNGNSVNLEFIEHPGAVLVVPFLPAGTLHKKESFLACAKREIVEETGYSAGRFTELGYIYPVPGYSTEKIRIYKAEKLLKQRICLEPDEVIEVNFFSREGIRGLMKAGKITDAKTICALVMCGVFHG